MVVSSNPGIDEVDSFDNMSSNASSHSGSPSHHPIGKRRLLVRSPTQSFSSEEDCSKSSSSNNCSGRRGPHNRRLWVGRSPGRPPVPSISSSNDEDSSNSNNCGHRGSSRNRRNLRVKRSTLKSALDSEFKTDVASMHRSSSSSSKPKKGFSGWSVLLRPWRKSPWHVVAARDRDETVKMEASEWLTFALRSTEIRPNATDLSEPLLPFSGTQR